MGKCIFMISSGENDFPVIVGFVLLHYRTVSGATVGEGDWASWLTYIVAAVRLICDNFIDPVN